MKYLHHKHYSESVGRNPQWAMSKIKAGKWTEGVEYFRDPEGLVWVIVEGVEAWLTQGSGRRVTTFKSDSVGTDKDTNRSGRTNQRQQTLKRPAVYELR